MISTGFMVLFWTSCVAQLNEVSQPEVLETVKVGDLATLHCYIMSTMSKRVWYKLTAEGKLELVAMLDARYNRSAFADESHRRYSASFDEVNNHLVISPVTWSDGGTYFCGVMHLNHMQFGSGTHLHLKDVEEKSGSVVQLPDSRSVRFGDSVTVSCSIHSTNCATEYNGIKWLKKRNFVAREEIKFYKNDQTTCQWTEGGETTCTYNLLMSNLSSEDAGTYYCVVTSCGQTMFGSGTKVILKNDTDIEMTSTTGISSNAVVIFVFLLLLGCTIASGILCLFTGSSACSADSAEGEQRGQIKIKRPEKRDDTWTECVYFSAKQYY